MNPDPVFVVTSALLVLSFGLWTLVCVAFGAYLAGRHWQRLGLVPDSVLDLWNKFRSDERRPKPKPAPRDTPAIDRTGSPDASDPPVPKRPLGVRPAGPSRAGARKPDTTRPRI